MTILANRLRVVHLDQSPSKEISPHVQPQKLSFLDNLSDSQSPLLADDIDSHAFSDKENPQKQHVPPTNNTSPDNSSFSQTYGLLSETSRDARAECSTPGIAVTPIAFSDTSASVPEFAVGPHASGSSHLQTADPLLTASAQPSALMSSEDQFVSKSQQNVSPLMRHIDKILHGKAKFSWPERSESLKILASAVTNNLNDELTSCLLLEHLNSLAIKLGEHLAELRPSIITSALQLISAILKSSLPSQEFIASIFPHLATVACEHSLKADDAIHSLVLAINKHTSPEISLSDIDNIPRLEKAFRNYMNRRKFPEEMAAPTERALQCIIQESSKKSIPSLTPAPIAVSSPGTVYHNKSDKETVSEVRPSSSFEARNNGDNAPEVVSISESDRGRDIHRSVDRVRSLRLSRMSWRAKLESPALSSRSGIPLPCDSKRTPRPSENPIADDSDPMPSSVFRGRAYSKEEVEEIRQTAIEAVIEKLDQEHREECDRIQKEKIDIERELEKERSDNGELRSVLEEYEVTMKQMVSQTNSQLNAHQMTLESENSRLKSELQGTTEAFDKLKEKYETTKQALERMETKEGRLVEQVQELKKNMVELQNWSNDLKTNTEKKLTKAFESVTSYRAMYMDKEAHERKAISDAEKLRLELEKSTQNLRETAGKLSYLEGELHKEQDTRADLSGQLSSAKATILRLTTQRETSQQQLDKNLKSITGMKQRIGELEGAVTRMNDTKKQLDLMRTERQELKARAFDDMKRIESLEQKLNAKDKELEEMNVICDEAFEELEKWKHARSS